MTTAALSVRDAISVGWNRGREHWGVLVGAMAATFAILFAIALVSGLVGEMMLASVVVTLLSIAVQVALTLGFLKLSLDAARNRGPAFDDLFSFFSAGPIVAYVVASLLTILAVVVGTILLVIPGIIAMLAFFFYGYAIVDRGAGPVEAMKASASYTEGSRLALLGLTLLLGLINMAGALALGVGLLLTMPVTFVAAAAAYDQLSPGGAPAARTPAGGTGGGESGGGERDDLPPGMIVAG